MKTQKLVLTFLAVFLLLGLTGMVSAASIIVDAPADKVEIGEKISIPVVMQNGIPFAAFTINLETNVDGVSIAVNTTEKPLSGTYVVSTDSVAKGENLLAIEKSSCFNIVK